jgi:hypothetical protein
MSDLLYVAVILIFFGLASAFVVACDRIVGPDEVGEATPTAEREAVLR